MRPHRPLISGLAWVGIALCGCRTVGPAAVSDLRVVAGRSPSSGRATEFHAVVAPVDARSNDDGSESPGPIARVTLELKEDRFEYRMRLRNPEGHLVTSAYVALAPTGERQEKTPLVVLFASGLYRDRFLTLRGTGTVPASARAGVLADEIQGRPGAFVVVLRGGESGGELWTGRLMEGR